jgi:predicted AAA+ superfamily ATPase
MKRFIDQELLHWKENSARKPLLVRGARQVGKTYSATQF